MPAFKQVKAGKQAGVQTAVKQTKGGNWQAVMYTMTQIAKWKCMLETMGPYANS